MHVRPLYDRVLIKRKAAKETTTGGLFIPAAAQEKNNLALVVAVGNGRVMADGTLASLKVEPGETVLIGKWDGQEIKVEDEPMLIIREDDILAVVDE